MSSSMSALSAVPPAEGAPPNARAVAVAALLNLIDPSRPSPPALDRLVRFFNTVSGTDKTLMMVQYLSKVLIWYYKGIGNDGRASQIGNLSGPVSDFRILLRYYALLPMIQWAKSVEQSPPKSPWLKQIERMEVVANFLYYPLEHIYWLGAHNIIPITSTTVNKVGMWSCRFWAIYVIVHFAHLAEEFRLLQVRATELAAKREKDGLPSITERSSGVSAERQQLFDASGTLRSDYRTLAMETVVNAAYFPLTVHWSLEKSSFPDVAVGIFGSIAAAVQMYTTWQKM